VLHDSPLACFTHEDRRMPAQRCNGSDLQRWLIRHPADCTFAVGPHVTCHELHCVANRSHLLSDGVERCSIIFPPLIRRGADNYTALASRKVPLEKRRVSARHCLQLKRQIFKLRGSLHSFTASLLVNGY